MRDAFEESQHSRLRLQRGVLTRVQALDAGLSDKAIEVRLRDGRWQRLHWGVYATFSGELPRLAVLWAAVLAAGRAAALSHHTAAELYGLLNTPASLVHVSVPSGRRVEHPEGVVVHYSGRLELATHPVLTPPRTRIEDTVLDLAETLTSPDEVISLILRASASRRTTPKRLQAAMDRRNRMRWRADLGHALSVSSQGAHSLLEFRYLDRVERPHGLPRGRRQNPVRRERCRQYQDVEYEGFDVVVELDGSAAHPQWSRWADIRRDNASTAMGQATLRYGWADVTTRPCRVAREVAAVLAQRGWGGIPNRCGRNCPIDAD
ncbi:MAG TPA: type IV toxin-antitoxin system AbiEi family antitoxin domain-containing protein [Streptosporangiaceae bacterium]|nr:type IV toxin-antitoxin system AbiEi family antitoxin domain-containing protein [Streptosporangiaceae bacterium]